MSTEPAVTFPTSSSYAGKPFSEAQVLSYQSHFFFVGNTKTSENMNSLRLFSQAMNISGSNTLQAQLPIFKRIMGLERYVQDRMETGTDDLAKIMKEANQVKKTSGVENTSIRQHCSLHELASLNRNGEFTSRYVLNKFLRALSEEAATEAAQILD